MFLPNNPLVSLYEKSDIGNKGGIFVSRVWTRNSEGIGHSKARVACFKRGLSYCLKNKCTSAKHRSSSMGTDVLCAQNFYE